MPPATTERRHSRRYPLQFDLEYRVFGKGHSIFAGAAKTLNMSSQGVLLSRTDGISKGQLVELSIRWASGDYRGSRVDLEVLGRVLRVDSTGTAVRILRYGFNPHEVQSAISAMV